MSEVDALRELIRSEQPKYGQYQDYALRLLDRYDDAMAHSAVATQSPATNTFLRETIDAVLGAEVRELARSLGLPATLAQRPVDAAKDGE